MLKLRRAATLGTAALAVLALGGPAALGSSHREAPLISQDPMADLNDVYAWVDKQNTNKINLVMTAVPLEEAGDAPNYYGFGENVRYDLNVDNSGDSRVDITYRFTFTNHVRNGETFLYNTGPVTSLTDPDLNQYQTYNLVRIAWNANGTVKSQTPVRSNTPVVPNNVGPTSMPNFPALVAEGTKGIMNGTGKVWAGQTDDPFYIGLSQIGDLVSLQPQGDATDTVGGFNTQAIALQVPKSAIVKSGKPNIGIWADTERRTFTNVLTGAGSGDWRQIERLGMPLTNEVLIGLEDKDRWNQARPFNDAQFDSYFLNPGIAAFAGGPATGRTDILAIFLTGLDGLNKTGNVHADFLRLNTSIAPSATENPLGVLGGDNAGFPNGRRLGDDVVDIELQALAGETLGTPSDLSDGVQENDVSFESSFPFLGMAHSGFEHDHHLATP